MDAGPDRRGTFRGVILGTAVGDSLGLPSEGLSRRRAGKLFAGEKRQRLLIKWGMVSDDTDHTILVAQSLLAHPDSAELFTRRLAWALRLWLLTLPAGIGASTLKGIIRLWLGFSPDKSGVYSAGNAPAMRAAPVGAFFADRPERIDEYIAASTRMTHTDPRALVGALAVAHLTALCVRGDSGQRPGWPEIRQVLLQAGGANAEWVALIGRMEGALEQGHSVEQFADLIGGAKGVTGYVFQTVPVAIYAWYTNFGDYKKTVSDAIDCGGDTDTVAAIAGALAGAVVGERGIPERWLRGIFDWPRGVPLMCSVADALAEKRGEAGDPSKPVKYFWPGLILRSLILFTAVLAHALRRLAPPY